MLICCFDIPSAAPACRSDRLSLCPPESKSAFQLGCSVYLLETDSTLVRITFATRFVVLLEIQLRVGSNHAIAKIASFNCHRSVPPNSDSAVQQRGRHRMFDIPNNFCKKNTCLGVQTEKIISLGFIYIVA